jgi:hypothetical protein
MANPVSDIAAERRRQIEVEGWTPEHDDEHGGGQLATAAACYADPRSVWWPRDDDGSVQASLVWPWDFEWWKPAHSPAERRRQLVKAGALIVAEIERLDRAEAAQAAAA